MTTPAEQALAAFKATGHQWRERAIAPPPFTPTGDQILEQWRTLLDQTIASNGSHAAHRYLRVTRLTPIQLPRDEQRFALEAETVDAWQTCAIVDTKGTDAALPESKPAPVDHPLIDDAIRRMPRNDLLAEIGKLRAQLADTPAAVAEVKK